VEGSLSKHQTVEWSFCVFRTRVQATIDNLHTKHFLCISLLRIHHDGERFLTDKRWDILFHHIELFTGVSETGKATRSILGSVPSGCIQEA
jgi:hypothetical protein